MFSKSIFGKLIIDYIDINVEVKLILSTPTGINLRVKEPNITFEIYLYDFYIVQV